MSIRRGSWDAFAQHIRWHQPPARQPAPSRPAVAQPLQARSGRRPGPRIVTAASPPRQEPPAKSGWLGRLLAALFG